MMLKSSASQKDVGIQPLLGSFLIPLLGQNVINDCVTHAVKLNSRVSNSCVLPDHSLLLWVVLLASNQTPRPFSSLSCKICNSVTLHQVKGLAFRKPAPTCVALFQEKGRELEPAL